MNFKIKNTPIKDVQNRLLVENIKKNNDLAPLVNADDKNYCEMNIVSFRKSFSKLQRNYCPELGIKNK